MSVRVPSTLTTAIPRSVTNATAPPFPVQRVPKGRDVFAARVVSGRALDPSRLDAQRTRRPNSSARCQTRVAGVDGRVDERDGAHRDHHGGRDVRQERPDVPHVLNNR